LLDVDGRTALRLTAAPWREPYRLHQLTHLASSASPRTEVQDSIGFPARED